MQTRDWCCCRIRESPTKSMEPSRSISCSLPMSKAGNGPQVDGGCHRRPQVCSGHAWEGCTAQPGTCDPYAGNISFSPLATHCPPDESQPVIERGDASTHASVATACVARMRMATPVRLQSAAEPRAPVLLRSGLRARRQSLFVRSVGLERLPSSVGVTPPWTGRVKLGAAVHCSVMS